MPPTTTPNRAPFLIPDNKNLLLWAREMAQQLKALSALPEDPEDVPRNHVVAQD